MKGRNIMNGVRALHEVMHETKQRLKLEVIQKLDFEKAYDKVCWLFLFQCLKMRGFNHTWCEWVEKVVTGGILNVKSNDKAGHTL